MNIETPKGQIFRFTGEEPYTRKDGATTTLRVWSSACKVCGDAFVVKTPGYTTSVKDSSAFGRIHCDTHKLTLTEVAQRWSESMKKKREAA